MFMSTLVVNNVYWLRSGWAQRRLPSMDTDDFETIPSSAEDSSNSSEEEGTNKNVGRTQDCSSPENQKSFTQISLGALLGLI